MSSRILFNVTEEMLARLSPEARAELLLAVGVEAEEGRGSAAAAGGGGPGVYPPIWQREAAAAAGAAAMPEVHDPTATPPRPPRAEPEVPGAPARRRRQSPPGGDPDDPNDPMHCSLHAALVTGGLGYSRNSSGNYSWYAPSGNGHCTICQREQREQELVNEMWRCLALAEHDPTDDNINSVEKAVRDFDVAGLRARRNDADLVCGSLRRIRDGLSVAAMMHRG